MHKAAAEVACGGHSKEDATEVFTGVEVGQRILLLRSAKSTHVVTYNQFFSFVLQDRTLTFVRYPSTFSP